MGARYPYYLLSDSRDGQRKEAEIAQKGTFRAYPRTNDIRQGFVYERVPHVTLKSNCEQRRDRRQSGKNSRRGWSHYVTQLNDALGTSWQEWKSPENFR